MNRFPFAKVCVCLLGAAFLAAVKIPVFAQAAPTPPARTGLEASGPVVDSAPDLGVLPRAPAAIGAPALAPAAPAGAAPSAPPAAPAPDAGERPGKLENYIRNNASVRKAEQLRGDPRVSGLPQQVRADFLNEFGNLMFSRGVPSRDSLLERTRAIDKEQQEKNEAAFKLREDTAAFQADEAILRNEIDQHNRTLDAYSNDLRTYERDLADYNADLSRYSPRVAAHNAEVRAHDSEVAAYNSQCAGQTLPPGPYARCMSWQASLQSRAAALNSRKASLDAEKAGLDQRLSSIGSRRASLERRRAEINASKERLDPKYQAIEKRRADLLAQEKKLADWETTLRPQWEFELKQINDWIALVERFNARFEQALARVQPPKPPSGSFSGSWNDGDRRVVAESLRALKDADLQAWLSGRAEKNRYKADNFSPITANGTTLRIKDGFFQEPKARRENLLAFEGGKVFWNAMKDQRLPDGATLESWFIQYASAHLGAIGEMKGAKHDGVDFSGLGDFDTTSQFAYVFRTQALQIARPAGRTGQEEWDRMTREFRSRVLPLVHDNR